MPGVPEIIKEFFNIDGNNILLVKGDAGTGKTIFSFECLINLAEKSCGFYFSTRVDPEVIFKQYPHISKYLPLQNVIDATSSYSPQKSNIHEAILFSTIPEFLRELYIKTSHVKSRKEPFIVIDSIDAVCETLNVSVSTFMRDFADFIRKTKAKAIVVTEQPGKTKLDYLADGVINLACMLINGRVYREMHIEKLRAIKIQNPVIPFTLVGGRFTVAHQTVIPSLEDAIYRLKEFSNEIARIKSAMDQPATNFLISEKISGKLQPGDFILWEVEETTPKTIAVLATLRAAVGLATKNFNVVQIPPSYVYSEDLPEIYQKILGENADKIKVLIPNENFIKIFEKTLLDILETIHGNGRKSIIMFSLDALESSFEAEKAKYIANILVSEGKKNKDIVLAIAYEDLKSLPSLRKQADKVFKTFYRDGCHFIYGVQPKTPIYNLYFTSETKYFTEVLEVA